MASADFAVAASAGAIALALSTTLWSWRFRKRCELAVAALKARLDAAETALGEAEAAASAFDGALLAIEGREARLISGEDGLQALARALGLERVDAIELLERPDPDLARTRTRRRGPDRRRASRSASSCRRPRAWWSSRAGRPAPSPGSAPRSPPRGPAAGRFAGLADRLPDPAWISTPRARWCGPTGPGWRRPRPVGRGGAQPDKLPSTAAPTALAAEAARRASGARRVRWAPVKGQRRAFHVTAEPLAKAAASAPWAQDVTEAEDTARDPAPPRRGARRDPEPPRRRRWRSSAPDAAADRSTTPPSPSSGAWSRPGWRSGRATARCSTACASAAACPRRSTTPPGRPPSSAATRRSGPSPDDLWTLPDGRTLRVVRQPHPLGGLLLLFSDITGELKLQGPVQRPDPGAAGHARQAERRGGGVRLGRAAAAAQRGLRAVLERRAPADAATARPTSTAWWSCACRGCTTGQFWRELKARVTDPDPQARAPISGEAKTSDDRIVAYQSRPLPDGATLIAFADVTDTRKLERRAGATASAGPGRGRAAEARLRRQRLLRAAHAAHHHHRLFRAAGAQRATALPERARGHVAAVRTGRRASWPARSTTCSTWPRSTPARWRWTWATSTSATLLRGRRRARWARGGRRRQGRRSRCERDAGHRRASAPTPRRLGQMLDHLIENALRQTPRRRAW